METDAALDTLLDELDKADAVIVGAGNELTRAAGISVDASNDGTRLTRKPGMFWKVYADQLEQVEKAGTPQVFSDLAKLVEGTTFHGLTFAQDGLLARALGEEHVTQMRGDWAYLQCTERCKDELYPAANYIDQLDMDASGSAVDVKSVPVCPQCGSPMQPWIYSFTFLEGARYQDEFAKWNAFLQKHINSRLLFLEVGLGTENPEFIKEPFWQMVQQHPDCAYVALEPERAFAPTEIEDKATLVNADLAQTLKRACALKEQRA